MPSPPCAGRRPTVIKEYQVPVSRVFERIHFVQPVFDGIPDILYMPQVAHLVSAGQLPNISDAYGPQFARSPRPRCHSVMMRSAHSTSDTKIAGLPNLAPHWARSASVTPRAREHAPHAKI